MNIQQPQAWTVFPHVFLEWFACHITKVLAILTFQFTVQLAAGFLAFPCFWGYFATLRLCNESYASIVDSTGIA